MTLSALDYLMASRESEISSLQQLLQMGKLVGCISQLIHVLQRERGTANIYLCSQGAIWGDRLTEHASQVERAEQALSHQLQGLNLTGHTLPNASRLFSHIATVLHHLSILPQLRQHIQAFNLTQPQAMEQYCDVIRAHLALVFEAADTSGDPSISRALLAMFSFMQGKELAGQERALAAAGFASKQFDDHAHQQLINLIENQERCFQTFNEFADAPCLALWQQKLDIDSSELERFRRISCTRTTLNEDGSDMALRWFHVATQRIDDMKQVEDLLEERLMACCRQRIQDAELSREQHQQEMVNIPRVDARYTAMIPHQLSRSVLELVEQQSRKLQELDAELSALRATLAERKLVERAKGLLMQHQGMTESQAHKTLRDMAMRQNKKLSEIASAMLSVADVWGHKEKS